MIFIIILCLENWEAFKAACKPSIHLGWAREMSPLERLTFE